MGTEDYAVGSIADLISGNTTPSKLKVVEKVFEKKSPKTPMQVGKSPKKPKVKTPGTASKQLNVSSEQKAQKFTPEGKRKLSENVKDEKTEPKSTPRGKRKLSENVKNDGTEPTSTPRSKRKSSENVEKNETEPKSTPRGKRKLSENVEVETEETEPPKKKQNKDLDEKRIKAKENAETRKLTADRTLFVGNVPITMTKKMLLKVFAEYGDVESVRIRGVPVADVRTPKKVAYIKKEFHPKRTSVLCYVRFRTAEDAQKALVLNGQLVNDHHFKVRLCNEEKNPDSSKALFIGNVSFNAEDEEVWQLFEPCGKIESVRLVRDGKTGIGKGFGYVNFESADSVELAMQMEKFVLNGRELRISVYKTNVQKKGKRFNLLKKGQSNKPIKNEKKPNAAAQGKQTDDSDKQKKKISKPKKSGFEGVQISEKKKKNKFNKGLLQKKKLVKKLIPKAKP